MVDGCNKKVISTSIFIPENQVSVVKPLVISQTLLKVSEKKKKIGLTYKSDKIGFTGSTLMTCFSMEYPKKRELGRPVKVKR